MKQSPVLLACAVLGLSAGPAFAFKNIAGCDLVAFAAADSPIAIGAERWQSYRDQAAAILAAAPGVDASLAAWRTLANELIAAQNSVLAPERGSDAYRDYLASDRCLALTKLNPGAVDGLLDAVAQTAPAPIAAALQRVTQAARMQIDAIERSARFRSGRDKTAMAAQYYCFVAGAIMGLLPPGREQAVTLESFGTTTLCRDIGRTG